MSSNTQAGEKGGLDMAGPESPKTSGESSQTLPAGTIAKLTKDILNDTIYNIIHDIVAKVHRDEKVARMRSAVIIARQKAEDEIARRRETEGGNKATKPGDTESTDNLETKIKVETDGAIFDGGKVYLKGNPLSTTKDIICPHCRLPRLLYPADGDGARPYDRDREYCQKHPLVKKQGYDVHGNPFATDKVNSKKKKTNTTTNTNTNTPASSPPSTPDVSVAGSFKHTAPAQVSYPTIKCPNCPRYFVVNRLAMHLDRCMGLSGRGAARNRTPQENISAASNTSAPPKRPRPDDDLAPSNQKKKKPNTPKKLAGKKPPAPSKLKNGTTPDMAAAESAELSKIASNDGEIKVETNGV